MPNGTKQKNHDTLFLPDFCDIGILFAVVLIGELLAFVLVLVPFASGEFWHDLAVTSLFIQWVGLTSTGLLCASRRWLLRMSNALAATYSYLLILAVTAGLSWAAVWVLGGGAMAALFAGALPWDVLARNVAIGAIISAVALRYFYVQYQWKRNLEREALARFQALQSRIRPHFLFNSMNTIASLTRTRPETAERAVEDLADLFRVSLGDAREPVTLERELEVCRRYLQIEELRMGSRLRVEWDLADCPKDALLPALSVQPVVENAVYHGVEPAAEGGVVRVSAGTDAGGVRVAVANSVPSKARPGHREGNRMALDNVAERLAVFFGRRASLETAVDKGLYRVTLRFPYLGSKP